MKNGDGVPDKSDRRPDLYIIARFLERLWLDGKEYRRSTLQAAVGLNYNVFCWYMQWLQDKNLVTLKNDGGKEVVLITKNGLEAYHRFVLWVRETVGDMGPRKRAGDKT